MRHRVATAQAVHRHDGLDETIRELRRGAILPLVAVLCVVGVLLVGSASSFGDPLHATAPGTLLIALALASWSICRWHPVAAGWVVVLGLIFVDTALAVWTGDKVALCLLAIPVGLAAVVISVPAAMATAAGCTVLIALLPALAAVDPGFRIVLLVAIWGTVGLMWLAERPLLTALERWWASFEKSRRLLEQARDYQVELKQSLQDLAEANVQLTRLNRLAQGLRQAADEARQAKEKFVASVSHELRTPLNMILGFGEMILKSPKAYGENIPPALLADLSVIVRNSKHLSSLIDDVLDLSQIEAGRMALVREHVSLHTIVEEASIAVRPLFDAKGLFFEADVPADSAVFCDPTRIREVVINLLSNAGRFTERGGVHVCAWRDDGNFVVSVADTGPGISDEHQSRLFTPFAQLESPTRQRYGGTGLGLSISRGFVELHGGKMWVDSVQGAGATFYFSLPVDPVQPPGTDALRWFNPHGPYEKRTRRSRAPVPVVQSRFVVVEDGDVVARLLVRYLDGAEVVRVPTFEEAAAELARTPAQALVANVPSPDEALQQLKRCTALPHSTPAIICSLPGKSNATSALGITDYLVKPVSRDELLAVLDRLDLPGRTVMVVDDEPEAVQLFRRMLVSADRGYRVVPANNGRQALEILRTSPVDVVLLDLVMPEMDGFQFLAEQSRDPGLRGVPVIVISARDPAGQLIVSNALVATRGGGLSLPQLLRSIKALSQILGTAGQVVRPMQPEADLG